MRYTVRSQKKKWLQQSWVEEFWSFSLSKRSSLVNLKNAKPIRIVAERTTAAQSTDFVEREKHIAIQVFLFDYYVTSKGPLVGSNKV